MNHKYKKNIRTFKKIYHKNKFIKKTRKNKTNKIRNKNNSNKKHIGGTSQQKNIINNKEKVLQELNDSQNANNIINSLEQVEDVFINEIKQSNSLSLEIQNIKKNILNNVNNTDIQEVKNNIKQKVYNILKAHILIKKAVKYEPSISKDLTKISQSVDGKMVGTEYKFKSKNSIITKINIKGDDYNIRDILRYTITIDSQDYYCNASKIIAELHKKGYITDDKWIKDIWDDDDIYKGINTSWIKINGDDKQFFELQIHTPDSLFFKEMIHDEYDLCKGVEDCKLLNGYKELSKAMIMSPKINSETGMYNSNIKLSNHTCPDPNTILSNQYTITGYNSGFPSLFLIIFLFLYRLRPKKGGIKKNINIDMKNVKKIHNYFMNIKSKKGQDKAINAVSNVFNNPKQYQNLIN